ncbi:Hypothetical protein SMAX5B_016974 [Scophthalmus maximus]|uniref:Uncharacterized protein n=1 Tax=Scophthalmus maximus TaxID=52904 RepID=A0A2U9B9J9_SCOMX|nr:Hypothetical protein SMAX5B_016974 [Scophthalmus maximus]
MGSVFGPGTDREVPPATPSGLRVVGCEGPASVSYRVSLRESRAPAPPSLLVSQKKRKRREREFPTVSSGLWPAGDDGGEGGGTRARNSGANHDRTRGGSVGR